MERGGLNVIVSLTEDVRGCLTRARQSSPYKTLYVNALSLGDNEKDQAGKGLTNFGGRTVGGDTVRNPFINEAAQVKRTENQLLRFG